MKQQVSSDWLRKQSNNKDTSDKNIYIFLITEQYLGFFSHVCEFFHLFFRFTDGVIHCFQL